MPEDLTEINALLQQILEQPQPPSWLARWFHWLMHSWQLVGEKGAHTYWRCRVCGKRCVGDRSGFVGPVDEHWLATGEWNTAQPQPPKGGSVGKPKPAPGGPGKNELTPLEMIAFACLIIVLTSSSRSAVDAS